MAPRPNGSGRPPRSSVDGPPGAGSAAAASAEPPATDPAEVAGAPVDIASDVAVGAPSGAAGPNAASGPGSSGSRAPDSSSTSQCASVSASVSRRRIAAGRSSDRAHTNTVTWPATTSVTPSGERIASATPSQSLIPGFWKYGVSRTAYRFAKLATARTA